MHPENFNFFKNCYFVKIYSKLILSFTKQTQLCFRKSVSTKTLLKGYRKSAILSYWLNACYAEQKGEDNEFLFVIFPPS